MPYTIDGSAYREIAERRFAADASLNKFENQAFQLPFTSHSVQHTYSRYFDIVHFRADFHQDIKVTRVRDMGHISLHFQLKGHSAAKFRAMSGEHPLAPGEYNLYFSDEFVSDLRFNRQNDFEYLAITLQTDYLLSILEMAGGRLRKVEEAIRTGKPFALCDKAMRVNAGLNMALHSLLHTPVADNLSELFINGKVTEIIALQLSQYTGATAASATVPRKLLEEVYAYIELHFLTINSPADVVRDFPLSEHQLKQGLRQYYNTTLYEMVHRKRMQHAMQLLRDTGMNISEIAWELGYSNATNFIQAFKRSFSTTPHKIRTGR